MQDASAVQNGPCWKQGPRPRSAHDDGEREQSAHRASMGQAPFLADYNAKLLAVAREGMKGAERLFVWRVPNFV